MNAYTFLSHVFMGALMVAPVTASRDSQGSDGAPSDQSSVQPDATQSDIYFFDDRAVFEVASPALPLEDFEEGNVDPGGLTPCSDPYDSSTNDDCWVLGDIVDGVRLGSSAAGGMVILGEGFLSQPSIVTGPFTLNQFGYIDFLPYVSAFGFDLLSTSAPQTVEIRIFGTSGLIATTQAQAEVPGAFFGVRSFQLISRVEYEAAGSVGELIDNLTFGSPAPILAGYVDRTSFDLANPGLPVEDFEEGQVSPGAIESCAAPINNGTSSPGCFDVGDILPGISFEDDPGPSSDGIAIWGAGSDFNPSIAITNNDFHEVFIIDFDPPVRAVGMDLQCHFGDVTAGVKVWGEGGIPIAYTAGPCTPAGRFKGLSAMSAIAISRIAIESGLAVVGGVDNVAFGTTLQIFADGFESGNTSAWSATVP